MTVESLRRSPLAHRAADLEAASGRAVTLGEVPFLAMVNLRVEPETAVAARVAAVLGTGLPSANRVAQGSGPSVLWLGPNEFLVVAGTGEPVPSLDEALAGEGSVVDVSANRTTLLVGGSQARDLLEKGCTLDLHPRSFGAGQCAQTTFARGHVVIWSTSDEAGPAYRLMFRPSFADYFADWLIDAAIEYGIDHEGNQ